ncbi:MAG: IMP dehydrogenase [Rhodospirillaceae bacterium]|jgi:IMP dehydrogenase|nr:IMP dehydrogenase [Rhodospirillaceae bacterium]
MQIKEALTFDDVLLVPSESSVFPSQADTHTRLTKTIELGIPLVSAAMDTVTESRLAIALAQAGGIGIIHKNLDIADQVEEVRRVKRFESGMVVNPITINSEQTLADAMKLIDEHKFSGFPVIEDCSGKLVGILTNRDIRFAINFNQRISELMTKDGLVTVCEGVSPQEAKRLLHKHRLEKLLVVDNDFRCIGLITVKDMEKAQTYPMACKDNKARLRVGAAVGVGGDGMARVEALIAVDVDVLVVDTAHGHSKSVIQMVSEIKKRFGYIQVIAGNIVTPDAARALIDAGVDGLKVGIGPGTICTTRIIAGVGMPQLSAIFEIAETANITNTPIIADGGIKFSGDIAKAIAAGASCVMIGSLFAGTEESPGDVFLYQGRSYKSYRGMGSISAMSRGSADRYFQQDISDSLKLVPEGIEGRVPYKGAVNAIINQLVGGLRASMGYTGNSTIYEMQNKCTFRRITYAGLRESHVHDVIITREAPNYRHE